MVQRLTEKLYWRREEKENVLFVCLLCFSVFFFFFYNDNTELEVGVLCTSVYQILSLLQDSNIRPNVPRLVLM